MCSSDLLLYRAIARMDRLRIRHLAVLDGEGRPLGMLTTRGLLRVRAGGTLAIGDAVETAPDARTLRAAHDRLPGLATALLEEKIPASDVAIAISAITRDITARAARLAERAMADTGAGPPPGPWCLLVLGSAGRGESLLAPDQDNALIVADQAADAVDGWFAAWGERINDILNEAGIPYCKGGVMAGKRAFRRSVGEWRAQTERWIAVPDGEALLNVDIFFDAVPVAGDRALAAAVLDPARARASDAPAFLRQMAEGVTAHRPPLGLFGRLKLDGGRLDLKRGGLLPIVSGARIMALKLGSAAAATADRLRAAAAAGRLAPDNAEALLQARETVAETILRQQIADIATGAAPGSRVDPARLGRAERTRLKQALREAGEIATLVQDVLTA